MKIRSAAPVFGFALAIMSVTAFGGDFDSYYTMNRSSSSAWKNGWGWPGNTYPAAGAKCRVPVEYYMQIKPSDSATTFPGSELAVEGMVYLYSLGTDEAWNGVFNTAVPFIMAPGGVFKIAAYSAKFYCPMEIRGTRANPALFQFYTDDTNNRIFYPYFTMTSAADAVARFCVIPGNVNGRFQYVFSENSSGGADLSGYRGTLLFDDAGATFNAYGVTTAGTLELANGAKAYLTGASGTSTFGGLKLGAGSLLGFTAADNTCELVINDRLELASGSTLRLSKLSSFAIPSNDAVSYRIFTLSAAAVANGIPSFEGVDASLGYAVPIDSNRSGSKNFELPTVAVVTNYPGDGSAEIVFRTQPVVKFTSSCGWMATPFKEGFDCTGYLSDNRAFHSDADYFADGSYSINVQGTGSTKVFPGHSVTFKGTGLGFYDDYEFPDMRVSSGTSFVQKRQSNLWPSALTLSGNIKVHEKGWANNSLSIYARNKFDWKIPAKISGEGSIVLGFSPNSDDLRDRWCGAVELSGDNSGYTGTMSTTFAASSSSAIFADNGWEAFAPSAVSNFTLKVHNRANLGGPLAAYNAAALSIGDYCRVDFAESAVFDDTTRGWTFAGGHGFLRVADGCSATLAQNVSYPANAVIVKEGAGALYLGATGTAADAENPPVIEVQEGYLGLVTATAAAGFRVSVGAGAGLAVKVGGEPIDLSVLEDFEYDESGDEPKLALAIDMGGLETYAPEYTVKLLKFTSTSGWNSRFDGALGNPALRLINAPKGYSFGVMQKTCAEGDMVVLEVRLFRKPTAFTIK